MPKTMKFAITFSQPPVLIYLEGPTELDWVSRSSFPLTVLPTLKSSGWVVVDASTENASQTITFTLSSKE